jgi:hypothetical protein
MEDAVATFHARKQTDAHLVRGFFVHGPPGCGKEHYVRELLRKENYAITVVDACDLSTARITQLADVNAPEMHISGFYTGTPRPVAVLVKNVEQLSTGSNKTIVKLVRPARFKKTLSFEATNVPIFFTHTGHLNKGTHNLRSACVAHTVATPTDEAICDALQRKFPTLSLSARQEVAAFAEGNFIKAFSLGKMAPSLFVGKRVLRHSEAITRQLFAAPHTVVAMFARMRPATRDAVASAWHENVVDRMASPRTYFQTLTAYAAGDYVDRIAAHKQVAQLAALVPIVKVFAAAHAFYVGEGSRTSVASMRYSKVLNKFVTQNGRAKLIARTCNELRCSQRAMLDAIVAHQASPGRNKAMGDVSRLDVLRLHRHLQFFTVKPRVPKRKRVEEEEEEEGGEEEEGDEEEGDEEEDEEDDEEEENEDVAFAGYMS